MGNIETVQQIYAAFGRGDIPAVLGHLDENVEWGYATMPIDDMPWLQPRHGRDLSLPSSQPPRELWSVVSEMEDPVDPGFVSEFQESTLAQPVPQAFFETIVQESLKLPARVWREVVVCTMQDEFSGELDEIKAPTLLVWGDQDGMVPRSEQGAQTTAIAGSRLVVYEGAGHGAHWEQPERFASDLVSFIETSKPI